MRALCINGSLSGVEYRRAFEFIKHFPVEGEVYNVYESADTGGYGLADVDAGTNPFNGKPFTFFKSRFLLLEDDWEEETCEKTEELCSTQR